MATSKETPKKLASTAKKEPCAGECYRLCKYDFKVQSGRHISTENLFKIPGKKGVEKRPLEKLLSEDLGLSVVSTPQYSSRVCSKCALKIRNAVGLFRFLKENLNPQQPVAVAVAEVESQQEQQTRWKRMSKYPSSAGPLAARLISLKHALKLLFICRTNGIISTCSFDCLCRWKVE